MWSTRECIPRFNSFFCQVVYCYVSYFSAVVTRWGIPSICLLIDGWMNVVAMRFISWDGWLVCVICLTQSHIQTSTSHSGIYAAFVLRWFLVLGLPRLCVSVYSSVRVAILYTVSICLSLRNTLWSSWMHLLNSFISINSLSSSWSDSTPLAELHLSKYVSFWWKIFLHKFVSLLFSRP